MPKYTKINNDNDNNNDNDKPKTLRDLFSLFGDKKNTADKARPRSDSTNSTDSNASDKSDAPLIPKIKG